MTMFAIAHTFEEALDQYHAGRKGEAAHICELILNDRPSHADAWHLLALMAHEAGDDESGLDCANRAIALHGANPAHYNTLGLCLAARNELTHAAAKFRLATLLAPTLAEAHSNLGSALRSLGDWDSAKVSLRRALELKPDLTAARYTMGQIHRSLGELEAAADAFGEALRIDPQYSAARSALAGVLRALGAPDEALEPDVESLPADSPERRVDLANAWLATGRVHEALEECQLALEERRDFPMALSTQGMALLILARTAEAEASLREAIRLAPGLLEARNQLGMLLLETRRAAEAIEVFDELLRVAPRRAETHVARVRALLALGRYDEADKAWRLAALECPDRADALCSLAALLADQGRMSDAEALMRSVVERAQSARARLFQATLLPPILDSVDELEARRTGLAKNLETMASEGIRVEAAADSIPLLFYLAHHGRDDRDLHESFARLIARPEPIPLAPQRPREGRKLRVGFFSTRFRDHTIGRLMRGAIARLPRERLSVIVCSDAPHDDETGRSIAQSADELVVVSRDARAARAAIARSELDILVYTDLGMDSLTYALACSRLAPIQCLTWGHPATSGLETIDYFLSSDLLEVPEADAHYSERLVRLPTLPIHYDRPVLAAPAKGRRALGLPATGLLYGCPQTLFKIHPDFDALLASILRRAPEAHLVLLEGQYPHWRELLSRRFERVMPDVTDRIIFLPPMSSSDFLALNAAVDVLLDPIHFGGGNTSYEAFAVGTPIVTLPSRYLKGRITQALYRLMGVESCIAHSPDDYVGLAVRLGAEPAWREEVRQTILASCHRIFEDEAALHALESFFLGVTGDSR
jgi:protein O-GlcNAc transferase